MTEKVKSEKMTNVSKPVPMKLFAAWEVDRTPSNCVPRLCTLTVTRLTLSSALPAGLSSVSLAARMHSSKRTLRSNEISLPPNGTLLDTDLDLNFSLQYPHFVKGDGNRLQILLQRRKKYKNRTILGYKTLAEGIIRMDQVLQRSMDMELELCADNSGSKGDKGERGSGGQCIAIPLARLAVHQLSSTPVDHDTKNNNTLLIADRGYSDEEEEAEFSSVEDNEEGMMSSYTSNRQHRAIAYNKRDLSYSKLDRDYSNIDRDSYIGNKGAERDSDSEFENRQSKRKGGSRGKMAQRNLKQKFVALLRRFRVPEELEAGSNRNSNPLEGDREIDELFQELESLSCGEDSGPELDTLSISSTPKPSLRPFFASSRSLAPPDPPPALAATAPAPLPPSQPSQTSAAPALDAPPQPPVRDKRTPSCPALAENDQWRTRPMEGATGGPDGSLLPFLDQDEPGETSPREPGLEHQLVSGSPPREKDEKRSRLFRTGVSSAGPIGSRKKQQPLTIPTEQNLRPIMTEHSAQSPTNAEPRRSLLEQISKTLGADDGGPPECLVLVHPPREGAPLAARLAPMLPPPCLAPQHPQEVRAVLQALLNKICKYCNTSAKAMQAVRVVLVGPDALVSSALRAYVDLWALRPPDWGAHVRFYIVPLGVNYISRYLASVDTGYGLLFGGEAWAALCERAGEGGAPEAVELAARIARYCGGCGPTLQLPIAEAMVAYRERLCDEDSSQMFVPFVNDVRIGSAESAQHSVDLEEALGGGGGSPPAAPRPSPPATPAPPADCEPLELQLDYWQMVKPGDPSIKNEEPSTRRRLETHLKGAGMGAGAAPLVGVGGAARGALKSTFRCLQAARLQPGVDPQLHPCFHITYATKEKKQKIMRLGKKKEKDKDTDTGRSQTLENVSRLICSAKSSHNVPLKVFIDGAEWSSVKFFQLSMQWQTHVKNFPVALLGAPLAPQELS